MILRIIFGLAIAIFLADVAITNAAPPGREPEGLSEFTPSAGYSRTVKTMRARRLSGIPAAPGQSLSLRGNRSIPVISVEFKNIAASFPSADYQKLLFDEGGKAWSMSTYYQKASNGMFGVGGKVLGPYKLAANDSAYEGANNGLGGDHFGKLLEESFTKADADIDFGQFDNDGPDGNPNSGDDDGFVDTVLLIHPEIGGECRKPGALRNIWSHSWHYSKGMGHDNSFTTNDNSNRIDDDTGLPVPNAKILIEDYTVQPGLSCNSTPTAKQIIEIGVFCHEYGHALGLPDLYDRSEPKSHGIGTWCLMASGSYGGDDNHADRPCHMSAWCKHYLGWADVQPLTSALLNFEPVEKRNRVYRFTVPGTKNLEYFLIEYRSKGGWDEFLHTGGLAIWHVDERVGGTSANWPFAPENEGQNDSQNTLSLNPPPLFEPKHQLVALIQADGGMHLENANAGNRGDAGDLFQSGEFDDDRSGKRGSRSYDGKQTEFALLKISVDGNEMKAEVKVPQGPTGAPPRGAAMAAPALTAEQRNTVTGISAMWPIIREKGVYGLTDAQQEQLRITPDNLLLYADRQQPGSALAVAATKLRTKTILSNAKLHSPYADVLKSLTNQDNDHSIEVEFDASGKSVVRIIHLSADIGGMETAIDAQQRAANWEKSAGRNIRFLPAIKTSVSESGVEKFTQNLAVDNKQLPVFGKQLAYYYSDRKLVAAAISPVQEELKLTGKPGTLDPGAAREMVADVLGIPEIAMTKLETEEGVYISKERPNEGRVAIKVSVPAGNTQRPISVFVDSDTGKILEVR